MKNKSLIVIIALFLLGLAVVRFAQQTPRSQSITVKNSQSATSQESQSSSLRAYFSPQGGCTEAVVDEINQSRSSILVQAYSFTSRAIAKALIGAHHRGVRVDLVADKSELDENKNNLAGYLAQSGISVSIDSEHTIAHNKVMVIDGQTVITGSFNFTYAAENYNAENLLVIHDRNLAAQYADNWQKHRQHSREYRT